MYIDFHIDSDQLEEYPTSSADLAERGLGLISHCWHILLNREEVSPGPMDRLNVSQASILTSILLNELDGDTHHDVTLA